MALPITKAPGVEETPLYAVLTMDQRKLLLPQNEIHTLEPIMDVGQEGGLPSTVGVIALEGHYWPVYCLNENMISLDNIPVSRRVCVVLNTGAGYLGVLCDQIESLGREHPRLQPVPACMSRLDSPLLALLIYQDDIACVSTSAQLAAFLGYGETAE